MTIKIGNAPCSWGVEFADHPRNPPYKKVLDECREAGYKGIELGPVGYMPEDPAILSNELNQRDLSIIGGVVFRPFHDANKWDEVLDGTKRTCAALKAHGAEHLVFIDSISERRANTAGRPNAAEKMDTQEMKEYVERIRQACEISYNEYGLIPALHPHAAGFADFEEEVEIILNEIPDNLMTICLDTGHSIYAGIDPLEFMKKHQNRISYIHLKDIDPKVKAHTIANEIDFYEACGNSIFCNLGDGEVDFENIKKWLDEVKYDGWCTVEQDCDPTKNISPINDAKYNRDYLLRIGFN